MCVRFLSMYGVLIDTRHYRDKGCNRFRSICTRRILTNTVFYYLFGRKSFNVPSANRLVENVTQIRMQLLVHEVLIVCPKPLCRA